MTEHDKPGMGSSATAVASDSPMLDRAAWARVLPFLAYVFFIFAGDLLERLGYSPAQLRWLYGVKIAAVLLVLAICWRQYSELHTVRLSPKAAAIAVAAGAGVWLLWISLNAGWMILGSPTGFDPRTGGRLDWPTVLLRIAGAALVVPVMEELFWRSFLMRWIQEADFISVDPSQIRLKSVLITTLLFGVEHNLWLAGIVAGAAYSVLYMSNRTIWSPILAHAVTNGLLGIWVVSTGNWAYW